MAIMKQAASLFVVFLAAYANAQPAAPVEEGPFTDLSLEQLLEVRVQTAALKKQSLRDAPADVTVISAADIRTYGYRTLGEALSNVRGFYSSFDGGFQFSGVRGFSLLGDYNTRFLVMINGHQMTDNIFSAMYTFGQDFGLDMHLVEQIEIVRGPSSALYGSNGVFATINILTRAPGGPAGGQASGKMSAEAGSFGETKLIASSEFRFGRTGRGIISASVFHTDGRTVGVSPVNEPGQVQEVNGVGREQGFHTFANLTWKEWNFTAMFGERRVSVPTGFYQADLGDSGTRSLEARNFAEVVWRRPLGQTRAVKWRTYYDQYRYDGIYNYVQSAGYQNLDGAAGDWVGSQFLYQHQATRLGSISLGAETNVDVRNVQYNRENRIESGALRRNDLFLLKHPNTGYAIFVQDEWKPAPAWTVYLGGRFDDSRNNRALFSPRAAAVYRRRSAAYKLTYSWAFRNPSTYERFYEPNPSLNAERIQSIEFSREQKFLQRISLLTSLFHYRLVGLIQGLPVSAGTLQYQNASQASATGFEMEVSGHALDWLDTAAGYTLHRVRGAGGRPLENSPAHLGHLRAATPLARGRLVVAGTMRYVGPRWTAYRETISGAAVLDLTTTAKLFAGRADLQLGVRNLTDNNYVDPLSTEHATAVLQRPGRSFYLKLTWGSE
jgi:outer membrane receptor protein involved in Fe transport